MSPTAQRNKTEEIRYGKLSFREALYNFPKMKVAILDEDATIIATNACWSDSAMSGNLYNFADSSTGIGVNYFDLCRAILPDNQSQQIISGIKSVMFGNADHFVLTYQCRSLDQAFVCELQIYPLRDCPNSLMFAHETLSRYPLATSNNCTANAASRPAALADTYSISQPVPDYGQPLGPV